MKKNKIIAMLLSVGLLFASSACSGKSKDVAAAEDAISAIGEVSSESGEAIANAEKLYNILTETEKANVSNRIVLVEAKEKFEQLRGEVVYNNAKKAYEKITEVSEMCISGMDDIYGAWYFGIYKASDSYSLYYNFAEETPNFTSDQLEKAAKNLGLSESLVKSDWQYCLYVVEEALTSNGTYEKVESDMKEAENILQELTNDFDDYTYYPKLKDYYSSVNSYVDFFKSPSGSFKQLSDTVNDYENRIRTYNSDVSFLFTK